MSARMQVVGEMAPRYATVTDYFRIFAEEMDSLYFLAFLLTADSNKAEECFVGGLEECIDRDSVSMAAARSLTRRAIVKEAIRKIGPAPKEGANRSFVSSESPATPGASNPFAFIVSLHAFERFVFVMSVLEGQPDEDCQSLLSCSRQEVVVARKVAMMMFGAPNRRYDLDQEGLFSWPKILN